MALFLFFFNDTATTEIYTLSLHDALPICFACDLRHRSAAGQTHGEIEVGGEVADHLAHAGLPRHREPVRVGAADRSEEHTSELQSRQYLVCRLLLEKKKKHV